MDGFVYALFNASFPAWMIAFSMIACGLFGYNLGKGLKLDDRE
jgi:hypothetical protein